MDFLNKSLMFVVCCLLLFPLIIYAQDDNQPEQGPLLADTLAPPPNADKDKDAEVQLAEYFTFNNHNTDYYYDLAWQVNQPCFWPATLQVWVHRGSTEIYHQTWTGVLLGGGAYSTTGWRFYVGPNASVSYTLTTNSVALWCNETRYLYVTATTKPFKIPHSFTVSKDIYVGYVKLNWV
jgi:hypothetical protein